MTKSEHIPDDFTTLASTAAEARARGDKYYFSGEACKRGHVDVRRAANHDCRACTNEKAAVYAKKVTEARQLQRFLDGGPAAAALYIRIDEIGEEAALAEADAREAAEVEAKKLKANETSRVARRKKMADVGTEVVRKKERDDVKADYWKNPEKARQRVQDRKAAGLAGNPVRKLRTEPWATDGARALVRDFYQACPDGMTVDHIIPFVHPLLAGLHTIGNLQYLTPPDNISKGNTFECTMEEAEECVRQRLAVWTKDVGSGGVVDWWQYADDDRKRDVLRGLDAHRDSLSG